MTICPVQQNRNNLYYRSTHTRTHSKRLRDYSNTQKKNVASTMPIYIRRSAYSAELLCRQITYHTNPTNIENFMLWWFGGLDKKNLFVLQQIPKPRKMSKCLVFILMMKCPQLVCPRFPYIYIYVYIYNSSAAWTPLFAASCTFIIILPLCCLG